MKKLFIILSVLFIATLSGCFHDKGKESVDVEKPDAESPVDDSGISAFDLLDKYPNVLQGVTFNKFANDVLGFSVNVPDEWGQATVDPANITRLSDAVAQYSGDNLYNESIFAVGNRIHFFTDKYEGERYPNGNTHRYGYADNIPALKESRDICDYEIKFENENYPQGSMNEVFVECGDDVKVSVVRHYQDFSNEVPGVGETYQYTLALYAYDTLDNGYFDNALFKYEIGVTHQIKRDFLSLSGVLSELKYPEEKFARQLAEFKTFVHSFKSFKPARYVTERPELDYEFRPEESIFRQYYYDMATHAGDFQTAYYSTTRKVSLSQFKQWYKDVYDAKIEIFWNRGDRYEYFVRLYEHNQRPQLYRVVAKLVESDGERPLLIDTQSSEKVYGEVSRFGDYYAYGGESKVNKFMKLVRDQSEMLIDANQKGEMGCNFNSVGFSSKGRYLTYQASCWEAGYVGIYDIAESRMLNLFNDGSAGITKDERYVYSCAANDMGGTYYINVYSLPDLTLVFNAGDFVGSDASQYGFGCDFESRDNLLTVFAYPHDWDAGLLKERKFILDFNTLKFTEVTSSR